MPKFKSGRQINYKSQSTQNVGFLDRTETPFSVGLGLMIYKHTRSRHIINLLSDMNLTINYHKILKIETNITEAIVKKWKTVMAFMYHRQSKQNVQFILPSTTVIFKTALLMENMTFMAQFKLFTRIPLIHLKGNL